MEQIDYLIVGHICKDLTPSGPRLGGTATFAALTAQAIGWRVGIVTSMPDDLLPLLEPLKAIPTVRIPAETSTTFENIYTPRGRIQVLSGRATLLTLEHIPTTWHRPQVVHLAPVADEVDPAIAHRFPASLKALTPQGWMRRWDDNGRVSYRPWPQAWQMLPQVGAVVFSIEDVCGDEALVREYAARTEVLAVTRGADGCTLFVRGKAQHVPAQRVNERDPTGAGDIFAAAFFIRLHMTGDPLRAAHFATLLAGDSVTREGLDSVPRPEVIHTALTEA